MHTHPLNTQVLVHCRLIMESAGKTVGAKVGAGSSCQSLSSQTLPGSCTSFPNCHWGLKLKGETAGQKLSQLLREAEMDGWNLQTWRSAQRKGGAVWSEGGKCWGTGFCIMTTYRVLVILQCIALIATKGLCISDFGTPGTCITHIFGVCVSTMHTGK